VLALIFVQTVTSLAGVTLRAWLLYVRTSRRGIVSVGNGHSRRFQGIEYRSFPLPVSSKFSRFGTVSDWTHLQGLSPLSWLSFSPWAV